MITTLIIDDDKSNIGLIENIALTYYPELKIVGTATNVNGALELIVKNKPQLLLLDIELHDKTAFDILKVIQEQHVYVVLITAYEKYALEAFKFDVSGYLLKPISIDDFIVCIDRIKKKIEKQVTEKITTGHLSLYTRNKIELIPHNEIIYLESDNSYTHIYQTHNRKNISSRSIKETEAELPKQDFIRVHRSYIVNKHYVVQFIRTKYGTLLLSNHKEIPVSQLHTDEVKKLLEL